MNYLDLWCEGYPIGSGMVDSGGKQYKARFCGAGIRWSRKGAERLLPIRTAILNKELYPHACRHTFAVRYLVYGGYAYSLEKILGHTSLVMTRKYGKIIFVGNSPNVSLQTFFTNHGEFLD